MSIVMKAVQDMAQYNARLMPAFFKGAGTSLLIFAVTLVGSLVLGWLLSLVRVGRNRGLRRIIQLYCWLFRGTPLMLQLMLVHYGFPLMFPGWRMSALYEVFLVFTVNYAAYFVEIFRGGIESIDRGQYEAAEVLGLTRSEIMFRIVLPQAFKRVLPSIGNEVITLVKDTSLAYTITVVELLRIAQLAAVRDFRMDAFLGAAAFYLLFTWLSTKIMTFVEQRFAYYR